MGENLVAGILKSIELKAEVSIKIASEILTSVKTTNNILSKEIGGELRKQTVLLKNILQGLTQSSKTKDSKTPLAVFSMFYYEKGAKDGGVILTQKESLEAMEKFGTLLEPINKGLEKLFKIIADVNLNKLSGVSTFFTNLFLGMGKKILMFGVFASLAAPFLTFAAAVTLPILNLFVIYFIFLAIKAKTIWRGMSVLKKMMYSMIMIIGIVIAMAIAINELGINNILLATGVVILIMGMVASFFILISIFGKVLKGGAKTMMWLAITTGIIVLIIIIAAYFLGDPMQLLKATGFVMLVLIGVALVYLLISQFDKGIKEGAKTMLWLAITTGILLLIIIMVAEYAGGLIRLLETAAVIGLVLFGFAILFTIIGALDKLISSGAKAMMKIAISLIIISVAMLLWTMVAPTLEDIGKLAALIVVLGLVGTILGIPPIIGFVMAGAAALQTLAISLILISVSMLIWTMAAPTLEDIGVLSALIVGLSAAYAGLGLAAPFILLGVAAVLPMAVSLLVLTGALSVFSKSEWDDSKTETLKNTIVGITNVFKEVFAELSWKDMLKILAGTALLASIGMSLGALANGLSKFAAGYAPIYGVNEKGEVIVTGTTPLDADLGTRVGETIKALITPLIGGGDGEPGILAKLGAEADSWWGESDVSRGIRLVGDIGNAIGSLASGLSEFGKGYVVTKWGTDDKGNPIAVETTPIDETFATSVANTIDTLVRPMIAENGIFAKLGKAADSWWGDSDVARGIKLVGDIGNAIGTFAEGLINMAQLKIPIYGKDKNGKPIIVDYKVWKESDSIAVGNNITTLVNSLLNPLKNIAEHEDEIEDGSELLGTLAKPLVDLGKGLESLSKIDNTALKNNIGTLFSGLAYFSDGFKLKVNSTRAQITLKALSSVLNDAGKLTNTNEVGKMFIDINASINKMPLDKLKELKGIMQNLKDFAKEMDGSFSDLAEVLEKLATVMANMDKTQAATKQEVGESNMLSKIGNTSNLSSARDNKPTTAQEGQGQMNLSEVINKLSAIYTTLQGGIEVQPKGGGSLFS